MTDREMLIEMLAIKLFEHDGGKQWLDLIDEDREAYRDVVGQSDKPEDMYAPHPDK